MGEVTLAASSASDEERPAETFVSGANGIRRRVRLTSGRVVETRVGRADLRRGEAIPSAADRAYLISPVRPSEATGRAVRAVDLFSGCGGLSLGLWEAARAVGRRLEIVAAVDHDETARAIFAANLPVRKVHGEPLEDLIDGQLRGAITPNERAFRRSIGEVHFLLAGPPCQGFTGLNNHTRGDDPRNALYLRVARAARVLQPKHVLIENVVSVRAATSTVAARTIETLTELGYSVAEGTVPLVALGVPQLRRRHVIVASAEPVPSIASVVSAFSTEPRNVRWAIGDLDRVRERGEFDRPSVPSVANLRRMAYLRRLGRHDLPNHMRPPCHHGDHSYLSMYGKLDWSKPAQTITSGYGSMGQGRYVHPNATRTLTPHEAARLQFFPDWFDFGDRTRAQWAAAIGNAAPMKLSYAFGLTLLR